MTIGIITMILVAWFLLLSAWFLLVKTLKKKKPKKAAHKYLSLVKKIQEKNRD